MLQLKLEKEACFLRNAAFFLTPKSELVFLKRDATVRQGTEKLENHPFLEIIVIDDEGKLTGIFSAKDLLMAYRHIEGLSFATAHQFKIRDIFKEGNLRTVYIDTPEDELVAIGAKQNIIPVVDSVNTFIGIVRRADLLQQYYQEMRQLKDERK